MVSPAVGLLPEQAMAYEAGEILADWMGVLVDIPKCIGCRRCEAACQEANGFEVATDEELGDLSVFEEHRRPGPQSYTTVNRFARRPGDAVAEPIFVKANCLHCNEPACVSACLVGAFQKLEDGSVVYDAWKCMGCRYCMVACPFGMTRYEWRSPTPRVRKCIMCHQKIADGELTQPACTAACPTKATIFGERAALLEEARRRIRENPGTYIDHIWGESELGGTSVLYISDVDLEEAGWPRGLDHAPRPVLAREVLHTVPYTFVGVAAVMYGIHWSFERRRLVALAEGESEAPGEPQSVQEEREDSK